MASILEAYTQGGWIIYFGESFSVSMDMVNDFLKIVFKFYGLKKVDIGRFTILWTIFRYSRNVLFNNEHLILIWVFVLIDNEFDLKITLRILNPENQQVY